MFATMLIAVPTGVKVFNWVATMWRGSITFETPMLFAIGFVMMFTIGGFSGLMLALVPADFQYHDTFFVVAHFHYVLYPGAIFGTMAAVYYWLPKWCGHMYDERLGKIHFWTATFAVNLTFFPMAFYGACRYATTDTRLLPAVRRFQYGFERRSRPAWTDTGAVPVHRDQNDSWRRQSHRSGLGGKPWDSSGPSRRLRHITRSKRHPKSLKAGHIESASQKKSYGAPGCACRGHVRLCVRPGTAIRRFLRDHRPQWQDLGTSSSCSMKSKQWRFRSIVP